MNSRFASVIRHASNVATTSARAGVAIRHNKNPHAVALGKMTSPAKAAAAVKNGEKGGRPKSS